MHTPFFVFNPIQQSEDERIAVGESARLPPRKRAIVEFSASLSAQKPVSEVGVRPQNIISWEPTSIASIRTNFYESKATYEKVLFARFGALGLSHLARKLRAELDGVSDLTKALEKAHSDFEKRKRNGGGSGMGGGSDDGGGPSDGISQKYKLEEKGFFHKCLEVIKSIANTMRDIGQKIWEVTKDAMTGAWRSFWSKIGQEVAENSLRFVFILFGLDPDYIT